MESFQDDFSRKTWVYFLVEKSEAFGTFKFFKSRVEKETGAFIRSLRTDRGGEFTSHEFTNFCHENGIHRQLTTAYSPQQNGVAERKNRTIMNMVRSVLSAKQIPKTFWPEAVNWTLHVLNRCPTLAMKNKTPEEAWNGHKPSVDHFRIFGCIAHVHVPDTKRVKLDAKSCKCILLGIKDQQWSWNDSHKEAIVADLEWDSDEENSTQREESDEFETDEVVGETESESDSGALIEENIQPAEISPRMERIRRPPIWMRDYVTGGKTIGVKWVFKTKLNEKGEVDKYKARLVAKGYCQQYGIDYAEVFAPVARLDTIRIVISLAAQKNWVIYQLDVKSAFLHGEISEEVFVDQPPGYEQKGHETKVYRVKKALYGLEQAPRAWYSRIESYFIKEGFNKCPYEHTLFIKTAERGKILIVCLYVDDLIYTGNDATMFEQFKKSMMVEFDMTDLGKMRYFLGIEVIQGSDGIFISQGKYAQEVLERFKMAQCNSVLNPVVPGFKLTKDEGGVEVDSTVYKQMVGSLMYLTSTRPDLMFIISLISRCMERPTEAHLLAAKRAFRYVKGTIDLGIFYKKGGKDELIGYTDSDYAGDQDDRNSTSGYVFKLSSGAVSWFPKKQPVVTLSTTEAEFIAAASSACQVVWLRRILKSLNQEQYSPTLVYCDNVSTIKLSRNPVMHGRSKHIDIRFHFLRDLVKSEVLELVQCSTQEQIADVLTKPLKVDTFLKMRDLMGVCKFPGVN
ncbi:hypothetical protein L3X38_045411 [Prunus dulcis]|uniref:Integrase catalytic domain-containing protein n=1 Tax=Prunus dulcis TaxID=3755 RepID=A0AAD4V0G6_PRUDU|nr:hypothetical protein L3X38_045411 [Prunus dulcis]